ncbi:protein arginine kinase [Desulfitispora alkaliphila]|uniref:protein arginine kinase n=1 Tax=Desulfitispora alkaliphila TaxID=622674 RepID=UPI003D253A73
MGEGNSNLSSKWMEGSGPYSDIVISSRIRLARNLSGYPFPHVANEGQAKEVYELIKNALNEQDALEELNELDFMNISDLSALDRQVLMEKHLISPQHMKPGYSKAVSLSNDEAISIMINEEDHMRIQCLFPGLQLEEALKKANIVDDYLEAKLDMGFDEHMGYSTACPTNTGTGLRASVMLHLPALVMTKQINRVLATLPQLGLAVRGIYGEGTEANGNLFQISNQITLGVEEREIIKSLEAVTKQLIDQERHARKLMLKDRQKNLEDKIYRAYGILRYARVISSEEALNLLSDLRLGVDTEIIEEVESKILNQLIVQTRPGCLQKMEGREMEAFDRDVKRAKVIRESLN